MYTSYTLGQLTEVRRLHVVIKGAKGVQDDGIRYKRDNMMPTFSMSCEAQAELLALYALLVLSTNFDIPNTCEIHYVAILC